MYEYNVNNLFVEKEHIYAPTEETYSAHNILDALNKQGVPYRVCCAIKHLIAWGRQKDREELESALGYIELEQK